MDRDIDKSALLQDATVAPRRKRVKKRTSLELFHWRDLPEYLRDNEFIFSGYRANTGVWGSVKSLFRLHNESGNIWSHLTGFFFFIFLLACILRAPPTPLAIQKHDLEVLWESVAARIENASESLKHQVHDVNWLLRLNHQRQHDTGPETISVPEAAAGPANSSTRSIFRSLKSIQHSLVDAVHGLESRLDAFSEGHRLPRVTESLHSSLSSVQHTLQDGVEAVQHSFQHGLESVGHTVRDQLAPIVEGMHLPEAVVSGVRDLRQGVSLSWTRLSGSVAHNLHSLEDFVACRLHVIQDSTYIHVPVAVRARLQWLYGAVDDILHRAVLSSVQWPVPRWPLYVFMGGVSTCLLVSSMAHLFGCCSEHVAATIWRFDYAGIVANIVSSFYPSVFYAFMCEPLYQWLYLLGISVFGGATLALSLLSCFQTVKWRATRATAFAILALLGIIPYVHIIFGYPRFEKLWEVTIIDIMMAVCYLSGAAIYALRIPERWAPGKFDFWLHSHQLFHVCVVAGAYCHYIGVMELLKWRDASGGCALEVVHRDVVRHAVEGGADLVDVQAVVEYLQRRMHEYLNLPHSIECRAHLQDDSYKSLFRRLSTCPA